MKKILFILVLTVFSCSKGVPERWEHENVSKHTHSSLTPFTLYAGNSIKYWVAYESWYDQSIMPKPCIGDLNKEGGMCLETPHAHVWTSARYAYRFIKVDGVQMVEVWWYCWIDGKSPQETGYKGYLYTMEIGEEALHEIRIEGYEFVFIVNNQELARCTLGVAGSCHVDRSNWLYTVHHYHGGNCPAPEKVIMRKKYIIPYRPI